MATGRPTIADTALQLIRERGPLTVEEITPEIVAAGRTRAKDPRAAVLSAIRDNSAFLEHPDGRFFSLASQLEGAVVAVRPTRLEREEEIVLVRDDLGLLEQLLRRRRWSHGADEVHIEYFGDYFGLPFWGFEPYDELDGRDEEAEAEVVAPDLAAVDVAVDDRGSIREAIGDELANQLIDFLDELGLPPGDDEQNLRDLVWEMRFAQVLHGPSGWLPRLRPRQLLGLRVEDGSVRAVALERAETTRPQALAAAARMGDFARRLLGPPRTNTPVDDWDGLVPIDQFLEWVAMDLPEVLRQPMPPLVEALEGAGLVVEDGLVGLPVPGAALEVEGLRSAASLRSLGSRGLIH